MPVRIDPQTEAEATTLYQSLWNNRERGEQLHDEISHIIDFCDPIESDQNLLMGIKFRISKIMLHLITAEATPIRRHLIKLFFNLDTRVSVLLLDSIRDQDWNMMDEPIPG